MDRFTYDSGGHSWLLVLLQGVLLGQSVPTSDISCVRTLELPTRGLFAARAAIGGTIEALIDTADDGAVSRLTLLGDNLALKGEISVAVGLSQFQPKCHGSTLRLIFDFVLEDPPTDSILPPAVRYMPPNRFQLIFRRARQMVDETGKTKKLGAR